MRPRARFTVVTNTSTLLAITDANDGAMSITNDAENVVAWLHERGWLGNKVLIYRDTDEMWDGLLHDGKGKFINFFPLRKADMEQAITAAINRQYCTYPRCKCIVNTSTTQPEPVCPLGLEQNTGD